MFPLHAYGVSALFDISINDEHPIPILSYRAYNLTEEYKLVIKIPGEYRITGLEAFVSVHTNTCL